MKIKVAEASAPALDWMVARAEEGEELADGWHPHYANGILRAEPYSPSIDWAQGGPIIEREKMMVDVTMDESVWVAQRLYPDRPDGEDWFQQTGPTPLIAAMRCYVTSKLGNEVEVPDELA